jgi:hypothetical protein
MHAVEIVLVERGVTRYVLRSLWFLLAAAAEHLVEEAELRLRYRRKYGEQQQGHVVEELHLVFFARGNRSWGIDNLPLFSLYVYQTIWQLVFRCTWQW